MADDVPIKYWLSDHPVPDLGRLPEERWREVLRQVPSSIRWRAVHTVATAEQFRRAPMVVLEVDREESRRVDAARQKVAFPDPLPRPEATAARRPRSHQVNFRLSSDQYRSLSEAAAALALKPAQLARLLTVRGVAQVRAEDA